MISKFQPLQISSFPKSSGGFIPKILPAPSLGDGSSSATEFEAAPSGACKASPKTSPTIELKRENERVVEILVRCGCGEIIRLECGE